MGFLAKLFGKADKKVNIAMCGLDNAGKTSILNFLKKGEFGETIATMGVNHEKFKLGKLSMSVMDLGGQEVFRYFWPTYMERADILIYVIDSSDIERLPLAKEIFLKAINTYCNPNIPILVLATKQDLPNICSLAYIIHLFQLTNMFDRTIHLQKTSALTGLGIYEAFQWIHDQVIVSRSRKVLKKVPQLALPKPG
ncbi:MAG: ADP-ribosylation factor family protein [Candidatus Heimdallarchaeota archaeon]